MSRKQLSPSIWLGSSNTRQRPLATNKVVLNLIVGLVLLLSTGLTLVRGAGPQVEEPGRLPDAAPVPPPAIQAGEGAAPLSWAFSGGPNYDSGWVALVQDEAKTLTHDLGGDTDDYVVDMQYRSGGIDGINQRYYGGADFGANPPTGMNEDDRVGAYWRTLTDSTIVVYRQPEDPYAEQVRVRIWRDPVPGWDSGWISLAPGAPAITLTHGLGGNADDYVVDMEYKSGGVDGINQRYYGGVDFGTNPAPGHSENDRVGAYWRTLDNATIMLYRRAEDNYAEQVRIRIWTRPTPTYDSGWVPIDQAEAQTLAHNIGGDPADYVVDMQYWNSGTSGVNQRYYGGADFGANPPADMNEDDRVGAYWRTLTNSSITVYRRAEDIYAEQVRIRIWCFWKPPLPNYDSGWVDLNAGAEATVLVHNLGGDTDDYLVDMQYQGSPLDGINRRYYGGTDFGAHGNEDDRVGAYWRTLTNSSITVFRRAEDIYAEQVRIRIWVMPRPDYDSGWVSLTAGAAAETLTHDLWGDYLDYFVDMQYRSSSINGVNQRYYGGVDFGANPPSGMNEDDRVGAYWRNLDLSTIAVYRRPEDIYAKEVRVRIWRTAMPDYESGWQVVNPDEVETWSHNLSGAPETYLVNMIYYDEDFNYINQRHLGGADLGSSPPSGYNADDRLGAYWHSLSDSDVIVYRRPEDGLADYLRLRIWRFEELDLSVTKIVTPSTEVSYHGPVTYSVVLGNGGLVSDTNVLLTDTLPLEVDFGQWVERPLGADVVADELSWQGTVTAGEAITFTFVVSHVGDHGDVVTNTARFSGTLQAGDDSATFTVVGSELALSIAKVVTPMAEVSYHGTVTYSVVLGNSGPVSDTNVFLTDTLPAEVDFNQWVAQPLGAEVVADELSWQGMVTAGQALTFTFVVSHVGDYGDVVTNTARFSGTLQAGEDSAMFTVTEQVTHTVHLPLVLKAYQAPLPVVITYGGADYDDVDAIQQTVDGGYVVAGRTFSFRYGLYTDAWVFKLDADGSIAWQKTYGGSTNWDYARAIQQTVDGGYIVAGYTVPSMGIRHDSAGVFKLDADGSVAWQKTYAWITWRRASAIQQTSDGGYIVAGMLHTGSDDVWVFKLNADGSIAWQKTYGGTSDDEAWAIQQTSDGGYVVAGYTESFGAVNRDVWVLKLNADGSVAWQKTCGGVNDDFALAIQQTSDGGYVVAGETESFGAGSGDAWVLKLNADGSVVWQKTYGGIDYDYTNVIQQTGDGGYVVAGWTASFGAGGDDAWVLKLNADGSITWQRTYGGTNDDYAADVQQTADGGYVVAGSTYSFGAGDRDIWVLKLDAEGGLCAGCPLGEASTVTAVDSAVTLADSNAVPADSAAWVGDSSDTVTDSSAIPEPICACPQSIGNRFE